MLPIVGPASVEEIKPEQMSAFRLLGDLLGPLGVGIHCSRCEADFRATNKDTDAVFTVKCNCREFRAANPLPTAGTKVYAH